MEHGVDIGEMADGFRDGGMGNWECKANSAPRATRLTLLAGRPSPYQPASMTDRDQSAIGSKDDWDGSRTIRAECGDEVFPRIVMGQFGKGLVRVDPRGEPIKGFHGRR